MSDFIDRPVFICGHPKAGTSLITALLDGHLAIVAYPEETLFFRRFLPAIEEKSHEERIALAEKLLIHIFEWNQSNPPLHQRGFPDRDYSDISFEAVRAEMRKFLQDGDSSPAKYLNATVLAFGKVSGLLSEDSRCWVEKSPYNEFFAEQIFQWWPDARCIHIVRDPRDNFVSYQRKQPDWTAKVFAWNWVRSTRAGFENVKQFGENHYLLLRFEDLLREPQKVTHQMADFLDIPWHNNLLQPTRVGDSWRGNSMFEEKYQRISTDPIGRWKDLIKPFNLAMLQIISKKVMKTMDYALVGVELNLLSIQQRIRLWRERFVALVKQP
jgi:hypothetical protein